MPSPATSPNPPRSDATPSVEPAIAIVRLEGVLTSRTAYAATAWIAGNGQTIGQRLTGLAHAAALSPAGGWLNALDGALTARVSHAALRGLSEDRIHVLAEEYVDTFLAPSIRESAEDRVRALRRSHDRVLLVAETISPVLDALLHHLPAFDEVLCNRLEWQNGRATGRVLPPIVGGAATVRLVRERCAEWGSSIGSATVLAGMAGDTLLLAAAGQPVVLHPDAVLRRTARTADWPIEWLEE